MAVRRYGKGDLCGISLQEETSYGVGSGDRIHGGVMTSLKIDPGITSEEQPDCGSRLKGTEYITGRDVTAKVDFKISKAASWMDWFKWTLGVDGDGQASGLGNSPSGRTVLFKVAPQSSDKLTGTYVNELVITSDKMGAPLKFSAQLFARSHEVDTDDLGVALASGTPLRCTQKWGCNNQDIEDVSTGQWTLTITQNLEKVAGADEDEITNASGQEPYLGSPTVTLEITVPARTRAIDKLRETLTTDLVLTTQIGGRSLTISGGTLDTDGTQRSQGSYNETIKITAADISIV